MVHLIRREPLANLDRLFTNFFGEPFLGDFTPGAALEEGTLALDVSEDDKSVIVRASLPGFKKEDIDVEIHDGILTVKAQHEDVTEDKNEKFYRRERRFGSVSRRVALPGVVVEGETNAELKDGILTLRIPKSQKALPKKVKIQ